MFAIMFQTRLFRMSRKLYDWLIGRGSGLQGAVKVAEVEQDREVLPSPDNVR